MKISAYAQKYQSSGSWDQHFHQISDAAAQAVKHNSRLLVLPGWSLGCRRNFNSQEILETKKGIQNVSNTYGIAIVAEVDDTYFFQPHKTIIGPFIQRFVSSKDDKAKYQMFAQEWNNGKRFVDLEGKTVGLLLCGENNYISNRQNEGNYPFVRYGDLGWLEKYDILVNPTHSLMGNWGKLHKRFEYLSQAGRTVIHVANDDSKSSIPSPSSLCIYRNSECVVMGDFLGYDPNLTVREQDWCLATVETTL